MMLSPFLPLAFYRNLTLAASVALSGLAMSQANASAQEFPQFPGFQTNSNLSVSVPNSGIAPVSAPNGYFGTVLLNAYFDINGRLNTEASVDGKTYTIGGGTPQGPAINGDCTGDFYHTCSLATILFNGRIIVALAGPDTTLNVYELDPVQGQS